MNRLLRQSLAVVLTLACFYCTAPARAGDCPVHEIEAQVLQDVFIYGPLSVDREFFGFVYALHGNIASAVMRGNPCRNLDHCTLNTALAARLIPAGAKVLGEWHTHPHQGASGLSKDDVRGAWNNRHIRCYAAYYARPNGDILVWDPQETSVPTAMNSRVLVGNYHDGLAKPALSANALAQAQ